MTQKFHHLEYLVPLKRSELIPSLQHLLVPWPGQLFLPVKERLPAGDAVKVTLLLSTKQPFFEAEGEVLDPADNPAPSASQSGLSIQLSWIAEDSIPLYGELLQQAAEADYAGVAGQIAFEPVSPKKTVFVADPSSKEKQPALSPPTQPPTASPSQQPTPKQAPAQKQPPSPPAAPGEPRKVYATNVKPPPNPSPKVRVFRQAITRREPLESYSNNALTLVARWLDLDTDLLQEVFLLIQQNRAYRAYTIPKPNAREDRHIHDPAGALKVVQRRILDRLLYPIPASNAAHGAVPGRSVVTNAMHHLPDAKEVLCLDLRHAFPTVTFSRVRKIFHEHFHAELRAQSPLPPAAHEGLDPVDEAIHFLAALTTHRQPIAQKKAHAARHAYCLPQGAPTSGYLLNLACLSLDRKIFEICSRYPDLSLRYSRYLDDLSISSPKEIPPPLQKEIEHAILKNGFRDNTQKTRRFSADDPPIVCGLVLKNGHLEADPELIRRCHEVFQHQIPLSDPRAELQKRRKVRGIIGFFRQIYGESLPPEIAQPYQEYRRQRDLPPEEQPAPSVQKVVPQRALTQQNGETLLAQWLDLAPEDLEQAKSLATSPAGYHEWSLPKGNGQYRTIAAPAPELKEIQSRILHRFLYHIPCTSVAHGFMPARSIKTNALTHSGAQHIINIDLQDAFPSVDRQRVETTLRIGLGRVIKKFGMRCERDVREEIITLLSLFTTRNNELPQGAPTSGYLLNLAARPLDIRLQQLLHNYPNITYTRYADDLTFSSPDPFPEELLPALKKTIRRSGFRWNPHKTRTLDVKRSRRLEICGLILDGNEVRIPRDKMKRYRSVLRRAATQIPTGTLDRETKEQIKGIVGFVQMIYGELPHSLARPYRAFLEQHPEARPRGLPRERISFYPGHLPG